MPDIHWIYLTIVLVPNSYYILPPFLELQSMLVYSLLETIRILECNLNYICFAIVLFWCLLVCLTLENFSLIWKRHNYRWRALNFDLHSALMAIEQWGFFIVPHLLWHGASVYNGLSPRTRDIHTCCRAFGSGAVTTCFYDLGLSRHFRRCHFYRSSFFRVNWKCGELSKIISGFIIL